MLLIAAVVGAVALLFNATCARAQMSAQDELATLRPADGFETSLFASEPLITNPSAIDVDTHGRVWMAEIQFYRFAVKDPPTDKIKVLEDTDGDGVADKVTVFADGLFSPMSVCVVGDRVYSFVHGELLVWEDKNGDLVPDGPPRTLLRGFSKSNHDHTAHSMIVGPDHKWYMSHGDEGFKVDGTDGSHIEYRWGAMVRGELDGSKLETIAVNFRNPYEICVNSFGEAFCSDNDNDGNESARICWILEGGNYGWFGGPSFGKQELDARVPPGTPFREHWHFRGHIPGNVPGTLITGFGSPTGICFYEGDAFGPKYKNVPLHTDPGPRVCRAYPHRPAGFGMTATSTVYLTNDGDPYFRPVDVCAAPDGRLYVADWYDGGVGGHAYNDPDRGRIFVLSPAGRRPQRREKPGPYQLVGDAIEGLKSPNLDTQYLARERLLAEGQKSLPALAALLADDEPNDRARALWVLDRIGGPAREAVVRQLTSSDAAFRALAVRILRRHGAEYGPQILPLAGDSSSEVRREVLLALKNLRGDEAEAALARFALECDGADRYLLEAVNIVAGERKAELLARLEESGRLSLGHLPLVQLLDPNRAAAMLRERLAQAGADPAAARALLEAAGNIPALDAGRSLVALAADENSPADVRRLAIEKLAGNLGGPWKPLAADPALVATLRKLLADDGLGVAVLTTIGRLGLRDYDADLRQLIGSGGAPAQRRAAAIAVAVQLPLDDLAATLRPLVSDGDERLRSAALAALVDLQDSKTLRELFAGDRFAAEARRGASERLMESTGGALVLLRLIDAGQVTADVRDAALVKAAAHPDANVRALFERFLPAERRPQKLGEAIGADEILALSGDAGRGEQIFYHSSAAQCKNCHAVRGVGAAVGPDLSLIGKKYERRTLLETILDPSKAIAPEFEPYLLETTGGQVYAGFLVERGGEAVLLKDVQARLIRVPADQVESLSRQPKSLMPELVLRDVTAQDAADLLAFLTTLNQGDQIASSFRILGPLDHGGNWRKEFPVEASLGNPDLTAAYDGLGGKLRWEVVSSDGSLGFAGIDTVKFDRQRKLKSNHVTHYFLVYVDSPLAQTAKVLLGSDDSCRVWLGGRPVHEHETNRALAPGQDQFDVPLAQGRNVLAIKVANNAGPGGVALGIRAGQPVELRTE